MTQEKKLKRLKGFGAVVKIGKGLRQFKPELPEFHWWRSRFIEGFWSALLIILNFYLVLPFFGRLFPISFSAPLLPFLGRVISNLSGLSWELSVCTLVLLAYVFSPLSLYFLIKVITARFLPAIVAALFFSLPLFNSRITSIFLSNDGAHLVTLFFIPWVAYLVFRFLREGSLVWCIFSSIGVALIALTSSFGIFILAVFLVVIVFSEMLLGQGRLKLVRMITALILAMGITAFWYNPGFAFRMIFSQAGKELLETLFNLLPMMFFVIPVLGTFGFLLFEKKPFLQPTFIALSLSIIFLLLHFAGRVGSGLLISFSDRYLPEVNFGISFLLGIAVTNIFDYLRTATRIGRVKMEGHNRKMALTLFFLCLFIIFIIQLVGGRTAFVDQLNLEGESYFANSFHISLETINQLKSQAGKADLLIGYLITGLTLAMIVFLGRREKSLRSRKNMIN